MQPPLDRRFMTPAEDAGVAAIAVLVVITLWPVELSSEGQRLEGHQMGDLITSSRVVGQKRERNPREETKP